MERKPGYYKVNHNGEMIPARWDGHVWYFGEKIIHPHHVKCNDGQEPIALSDDCTLGCRCIDNPDGTVTVICTQ